MTSQASGMTGVLVAAEGQAWEPGALQAVAAAPDLVTVRRCLDINDLLAVAATGTAHVAVVAAPTPGIDRDLVDRLAADGVVVVAVVPQAGTPALSLRDLTLRLESIGVSGVLSGEVIDDQLVATVRESLPRPGGTPSGITAESTTGRSEGPPESRGQVVAVWGTNGAPGRTMVSTGLAAGLARADLHTLLVDADPYGGTVAQQLGVLDDSSGVLAAARQANAGSLEHDRLRAGLRSVGEGLEVLTGLPRSDRWSEIRPASLVEVLGRAAERADYVVVDCGFGGEPSAGVASARGRDALVSAAVDSADQCVVVGSAEPVGLTRLARLLVDARQVRPAGIDQVVVNRMRAGLGWREHEITDMVARVSPGATVHFAPFDLDAADEAGRAGRSVVEMGDSPLSGALLDLAVAVSGEQATKRRAGRRHRGRWRAQTLSSR